MTNLTIVLTTHKLKNWVTFSDTLRTLAINVPDIKSCQFLVSLAVATGDDVDHIKGIISKYITKYGFSFPTFVVTPKGSQRNSFCTTIKEVNTEFFYLTEHDWKFLKPIDLHKLVKLMVDNSHVNNLYFNRRPNVKFIAELFLSQTCIDGVDLVRTSKWALNPSIVRTKMWHEQWIPMLDRAPQMQTPLDIEPIIHRAYKKEINDLGFDMAHSLWGQYSYGKLNNDQVVFHMDGSAAGKKDFVWTDEDIENHNTTVVPTLQNINILNT